MSSSIDDEWTDLDPISTPQIKMADIHETPNTTDATARECTINTKSTVDEKKHNDECTCDTRPPLVRQNSVDSIDEEYRRPRRAGRVPPLPPQRRYTPSPHRYNPLPNPFTYESRYVSSSSQLLEKVGKEDGIVDLPAPAIRNVYLTTYPFGDKDVKKWAWLLAAGVEDEYVAQSFRGDCNGGDEPAVERVRQRRGEVPIYDPGNIDLPSVYLSHALDTEVVPEDSKHNVRYLIVTQNRLRPAGCKLLVAESRKAAGVLIYYEILRGDSVLFVGATVHQCKSISSKKYKKVASLDEAVSLQDEGFVGIVC